MKKTLHFSIVLATMFVACKKDVNPTVVKSQKELLVENKWYLKAILITPPLMGMSNQFDSLRPCEKDDTTTYRTVGKVEIDNGLLKCSPSSSQIDSSTGWKLQDNNLITIMDFGTQIFRDTFNIELLDDKYLNLGISYKFGKVNYKYVYKYERN